VLVRRQITGEKAVTGPVQKRCSERGRSIDSSYDTIRYDTVYLRTLISLRNGQLSARHRKKKIRINQQKPISSEETVKVGEGIP